MCAVIHVADLQYETFELLDEDASDRLATRQSADALEHGWEEDTTESPEFDLFVLEQNSIDEV